MNDKAIIFLAGVLGMLSVVLGAFGAHALEAKLSLEQLDTYQTGNTYQFYHSLLLLGFGLLKMRDNSKILNIGVWFAIFGIIFFSGSLYLIACKDILRINTSIIGPITPLGGLLFIGAWIVLVIYALKLKR